MMSNWSAPPHFITSFWSMKSALVMKGYSSYVSQLGDEIVPSSEIADDLVQACLSSSLLMKAAQEPDTADVYAYRMVRRRHTATLPHCPAATPLPLRPLAPPTLPPPALAPLAPARTGLRRPRSCRPRLHLGAEVFVC